MKVRVPVSMVDGLCDLDMGYNIYEHHNHSMYLPYQQVTQSYSYAPK